MSIWKLLANGEDFSLATTSDELATAILNVYRNQGYLDAKVAQVTVESPSITPERVYVPMKATITEGGQTPASNFTWASSS